MTQHKTKMLIIGSGPAAYTAAIYAARAAIEPLQVMGAQPGGQLMITTDVENYPGFAEAVQGPWLVEQMRAQAEAVGTKQMFDTIVSVDFSSAPYLCKGDSGDSYLADTVVICTGAQAKWLGIKGEEEFMGFGVSACATCDGFFFKDQPVAVIGGGNTAVEEALYMTNHASKVTLIHRRDELRADKTNQQRLFNNEKIEVVWDSVVEEMCGGDDPKALTHLMVKNVKTDEVSKLDVDGVFVAIGHTPMTGIFKGQVDMDAEGYIQAKPGSTVTNVAGVFAAGDVQDKIFRQAVTAAGQGCMAALEAEKYLSHKEVQS